MHALCGRGRGKAGGVEGHTATETRKRPKGDSAAHLEERELPRGATPRPAGIESCPAFSVLRLFVAVAVLSCLPPLSVGADNSLEAPFERVETRLRPLQAIPAPTGKGFPIVLVGGYYGLLNAGDLLSTEYAREYGAGERNRLGQTYNGRLGLKLGATAGLMALDFGLSRLERRRVTSRSPGGFPEVRKPFLAKAASVGKWGVRVVALGYYAQLTVKNVQVGTKQKGAR
jgi:hypothetical protein